MTFGGEGYWKAIDQQDQADKLIKKAVGSGIHFINTANIYSFWSIRSNSGAIALKSGSYREKLIIATKVRGTLGEILTISRKQNTTK